MMLTRRCESPLLRGLSREIWGSADFAGTSDLRTVIDPIPALFVCVLPDGPLQFGCGTWLTSRKSTRSDAVVPTAKKGNAHRLSGLLGK
jgi:hypothetical protein